MKRILSVLLALAAVAALVPAVHAQCTNATLTGNYGFTFSGFQFRGMKGMSLPWQGVGLMTFDGAGNASGNFTFSLNGQIATSPYAATYTVNPDCTGSVTGTPPIGGANATLVIVSGGAEVFAVDTSTYGVTMTLDFKRQ
jgi:hypothetical protein